MVRMAKWCFSVLRLSTSGIGQWVIKEQPRTGYCCSSPKHCESGDVMRKRRERERKRMRARKTEKRGDEETMRSCFVLPVSFGGEAGNEPEPVGRK